MVKQEVQIYRMKNHQNLRMAYVMLVLNVAISAIVRASVISHSTQIILAARVLAMAPISSVHSPFY